MAIAQSEALGRGTSGRHVLMVAGSRPAGANGLLLLGMPAWDVSKPFHALAVVAGIARETSIPVRSAT